MSDRGGRRGRFKFMRVVVLRPPTMETWSSNVTRMGSRVYVIFFFVCVCILLS